MNDVIRYSKRARGEPTPVGRMVRWALRKAVVGPITNYLNKRAAERFYNTHESYPGAEYALAQPPVRAS